MEKTMASLQVFLLFLPRAPHVLSHAQIPPYPSPFNACHAGYRMTDWLILKNQTSHWLSFAIEIKRIRQNVSLQVSGKFKAVTRINAVVRESGTVTVYASLSYLKLWLFLILKVQDKFQ